jgi:chromosome segregation protein
VGAIEEYRETYERHAFLSGQVDDLNGSADELRALIAKLDTETRAVFTEAMTKINAGFAEVFAELFGGGTAELSFTDESDVLTSGIEINVQPPGKLIKQLSLLSGGEQALTAIALNFALLKLNPAPFCMLDEIEANLDDANTDRLTAYLAANTGRTQYILITHKRGVMETADRLYGVTMQERGISRVLTVNVKEMAGMDR